MHLATGTRTHHSLTYFCLSCTVVQTAGLITQMYQMIQLDVGRHRHDVLYLQREKQSTSDRA